MSDNPGNHERYVAHGKVKTSSDRSFGIVFSVFFMIVGLLPLLGGSSPAWWPICIAAVFMVAAFTYPRLLSSLNRLWTAFGLLLHRIVNPIVMGFLFFLVVTPVALTMRILGKRPLDIELDSNAASYWIKREPPGPAPETMKRQF